MKRCPQCDSFFPDAEHFCEHDGTELVNVATAPNPLPHPRSNWGLLPIGVFLGVLLGILLVLVYLAVSRQTLPENSNTISSSSSSAQPQQSLPVLQSTPLSTASPSVEPSVEPSASPSIETPSPVQIQLSDSSPISTAPGAKGSTPVIIRLESGLTIEADEAWQTGEGIWYRKHGVVSLLDPKNVKAIERVSPAAPQPSASTSPSP